MEESFCARRVDHTAKNPDYGIKMNLDIKAQEGEARPVKHSRMSVVCVFTRANPSAKSDYNAGHLMCLRESSQSSSVLLVSQWRTGARRQTTVPWTSLLNPFSAEGE